MTPSKLSILLVLLALLTNSPIFAKTVKYDINIDYKIVNITGKPIKAMAVGNSIPAPTIEATEGDTLQVTFHNKMDVETSIHWHGILLPNDQDGVPYLTTIPIRAGSSHTFRYPIIQSGTYWYHSHTNLQEQRGVYGALVLYPKKETLHYDREHVIVLSDWSDEDPRQIMANLKNDGDYYALKKQSVQSWDKVIAAGWPAIKDRLRGAWSRMGPMDISDIAYDAFLSNGKKTLKLGKSKKGEKIRLRIINAAASSYFNIEFSGGKMKVVAADGLNVMPFETDRIRIAIAETYDVIVTMPDNKAYELRATSEDGTGFSSTILGEGEPTAANTIPRPNLLVMQHGVQSMYGAPMSHAMLDTENPVMSKKKMDHAKMMMDHSMMKMDHSKMTLSHKTNKKSEYAKLKSTRKTNLPKSNPIREVILNLTGNMERFVWSFNNKTLSEADKIMIKKGENGRFVFKNTTMMHHPLHLHGHFFRVLNGQGDYAPLKHTVNIPPMEKVIIEFYANEEKDWFFHCHNLYHMKAGMSRIISYSGSQTDPILLQYRKTNPNPHDNQWFYKQQITIASNKTFGLIRPSNTRHALELEFDVNNTNKYDMETKYLRSLNRFTDVYMGGRFEKEEGQDRTSEATIGLRYVLPMLIESELEYNSNRIVQLELASKLQLTERLAFMWEWQSAGQFELELEYEFTKKISISANYDSEFLGGAGIKISL